MLSAVRALRERWRDPVPPEPVGDDPAESVANRDNDLNFGIRRVRGTPLRLLIDAALAALAGVLDLAGNRGVGFATPDWIALVRGFDVLCGWLHRPECEAPPLDVPVPVPVPAGAVQPEDALRRWVRGHHVFMALAQGAGMALACLRTCHERDDLPGAAASVQVGTALLQAS